VTIAIGLVASDGIVLASDSQEGSGYAGSVKNFASKITFSTWGGDPQGSTAIAGAGGSGYADAFMQTFNSTISPRDSDPGNRNDLQHDIEALLLGFYGKHVIPFSGYPDHDRPDVCFVIGHQCGASTGIWTTDKTTLTRHYEFGAIGAGAPYAKAMFHSLYHVSGVNVIAALAVYVVLQVRETIEGCGKETQVVVLSGGQAIDPFRGQGVDALEDLFHSWNSLHAANFWDLLGMDCSLNATASIARVRKQLRSRVRSYIGLLA
jgi:hypothetical protein